MTVCLPLELAEVKIRRMKKSETCLEYFPYSFSTKKKIKNLSQKEEETETENFYSTLFVGSFLAWCIFLCIVIL